MASIESRPLLQSISDLEEAGAHRVERQPIRIPNQVLSVVALLEEAARVKYGRRIRFLWTPTTEAQLQRFWDNLRISITPVDTEPREVGRSIVDITTKDYVNSGSESDESIIEICKPKGTSAEWYVQNGLTHTCSTSSNIGTNIMQLAGLVPVTGSVGAVGSISKGRLSANTLSFIYKREEKFVVPPRSKVTVTVTSYAIRYSFHYMLQLSAMQSEAISIKFQTHDLWGLSLCCPSSGFISARELLTARQLPGYGEESGWVHFTQEGILNWVGDGSKVQKIEQPLS